MTRPSATLPRAIRPFVEFPAVLRAHGFAVAPEQTMGFVEAIGLLGPRQMDDIRRAAQAMLAIPAERETEFDALFHAFFLGRTVAAAAVAEEVDEVEAYEPRDGEIEIAEGEEINEVGAEATASEALGRRSFADLAEPEALDRFARLAPARLPRRLSYRRAPSRRGDALDMRRTLRRAVRHDGEVLTLSRRRRKTRQRRIVLLLDVSGSMKERTDSSLRFAHALARACDRLEAFTLGTRLTRITPALAIRNREQALARTAALVADFDGGTRIGEALRALLAVPRFAGFARGAAVVMLSDGLERGAADAMVDAVWRLSRMAWRLDWLTPLAADRAYMPETEALAAVRPYLDSLSDGSRVQAVCDHMLTMAG